MQIEYAIVFSNAETKAGSTNGNAAAVILCQQNSGYDLSSEAQRQQLARLLLSQPEKYFNPNKPTPTALCFVDTVLDGNTNTPSIECFSNYSKIICCGHGLLASNAILNKITGNASASNTYRYDQKHHWIKLNSLSLFQSSVPDWAGEVFSLLPSAAAYANSDGYNGDAYNSDKPDSNDSGYWIFEWPPQSDKRLSEKSYHLQQLVVNHKALSKHTQRAVIATQWLTRENSNKQDEHHQKPDFLQRYFAPQYGVNEDSATGSAHRVLASYWADKHALPESEQIKSPRNFSAYQCSKAGGVLHSQAIQQEENNIIWIGGQVDIAESLTVNL